MITDNLVLIEMVFGATVVFGFGFYQLWSLNRETRKDDEKADDQQAGKD